MLEPQTRERLATTDLPFRLSSNFPYLSHSVVFFFKEGRGERASERMRWEGQRKRDSQAGPHPAQSPLRGSISRP